MDVAVRHMERHNKRALRKFGRGLLAFCLSFTAHAALFLASLEPIKGVIMLAVGGWCIHTLLRYGIDIKADFHIRHRSVVRATWSHDDRIASAPMEGGGSDSGAPTSSCSTRMSGCSTSESPLHEAVEAPPEALERGTERGTERGGPLGPSAFGNRLEALSHHLEGASCICTGCLSVGLLPMRPLWRMDKLLPRAYEVGMHDTDERARARQRCQQAVADQIWVQQSPLPEHGTAPTPGASGGLLDFARGLIGTSTSAREPLLPT